ncbi:C-type lectin protein [Ranid herpesvirus 3]|uniref:C-type lectin protein n=1 Tax=Ranid herpesvirus 3 TaxID=1987509 RepID=A0A1X9T5F4_9VIRU|nr:C-type lectin protein [Ranid herpesvirus 3]ARR28934.1 C-type lectin protein [Ranid herpesvirus 3]
MTNYVSAPRMEIVDPIQKPTRLQDFITWVLHGEISLKVFIPVVVAIYSVFFILLAVSLSSVNNGPMPLEEPRVPSLHVNGTTGYIRDGVVMCAAGWYMNATTCYGMFPDATSAGLGTKECERAKAFLLPVDKREKLNTFLPMSQNRYWVDYANQENCTYVTKEGLFGEDDCNVNYPFICARGLL